MGRQHRLVTVEEETSRGRDAGNDLWLSGLPWSHGLKW